MQSRDSPLLNKKRRWQCFPFPSPQSSAASGRGSEDRYAICTITGSHFLRQPPVVRRWVSDGFAVILSLSGDSAAGLTLCMRCDVRVADLQVGRTLWDLVVQCQCPPCQHDPLARRRGENGQDSLVTDGLQIWMYPISPQCQRLSSCFTSGID